LLNSKSDDDATDPKNPARDHSASKGGGETKKEKRKATPVRDLANKLKKRKREASEDINDTDPRLALS